MSATMKLSDATDFRKAYQREFSIAKKTGVWDGIEDRLEAMAVEVFGPAKKVKDSFAPPKVSVKAKCLHCGQTYQSREMVLAYRPQFQHPMVMMLGRDVEALEPLWWCRTLTCDGAGYGYDIRTASEE